MNEEPTEPTDPTGAHIFAKVDGKLCRWDATELPYTEAIALAEAEVGVRPVLALFTSKGASK
jgi:hypothetical protein